MAISPTVNQYMQQPESSQGDVESQFKHVFSDMAFNTLRAKYPALLNCVITLKTLAVDVEEGTAFGVFILESGNSFVYVPVVMAGGSIVSCEMAYDKDGDQLFPLNAHTIKEITNSVFASDPRILQNDPHVEDTRTLFHNMVRPPSSSNVVLAGEREGISALPNACKAMLSEYLQKTNPKLLSKLASFYDVEFLAHKLAKKPESKIVEAEYSLPEFLSLDTLTKQAADSLSNEEKASLRKNGYLVKKAENSPVLVAGEDALPKAVEEELMLTSYPDGYHKDGFRAYPAKSCFEGGRCPVYPVGTADLFSCDAKGVQFTPVLICGTDVLSEDGRRRRVDTEQPVLVRDPKFINVDISRFSKSLVPLSKVLQKISSFDKYTWPNVSVIVPMRNNSYSLLDTRHWLNASPNEWEVVDDTLMSKSSNTSIMVSPDLRVGYITDGSSRLIVPQGSLFLVVANSEEKPLPAVESLSSLQRILKSFGSRLSTVDNGAGLSITDSSTEKTASFANAVEAAGWLHSAYGMNADQIETVLHNQHTRVFRKHAFMDPAPEDIGLPPQTAAGAPLDSPAQQEEIPAQPQQPDFDSLNDFAETEDPEMFDVGVLANFAEYPDVKVMLVDYLPDFTTACDKVGRILLLFTSQKKAIEKFYGADKCSTLLASCRRIFTILGDLVASLKSYVSMAQ